MKPQTFECWADLNGHGEIYRYKHPNGVERPELSCNEGCDAARVRVTVTPIEEKEKDMKKGVCRDCIKTQSNAAEILATTTGGSSLASCQICGQQREHIRDVIWNPAAAPPLHQRQPSEPWDGKDYFTWHEGGHYLKHEAIHTKPQLPYWPADEFEAWIERGTDKAMRIAELEGVIQKFAHDLKLAEIKLCQVNARVKELEEELAREKIDFALERRQVKELEERIASEKRASERSTKPPWQKPEEWTEKDGPGMEWLREPMQTKSRWWYFYSKPEGPWLRDAEVIAALGRPEEEKPPIALSGDAPPVELRVGMWAGYRMVHGDGKEEWIFRQIEALAWDDDWRVKFKSGEALFVAHRLRVQPPKLEEMK